MPRDISGNYTLPVGNPVVSGTIIDVDWANPTMSDIAAQLNNVITRDGVLAATNPIKFANGAVGAPSITFNSDPAMGLYRIGTNIIGLSTAGTERLRIDASGLFTFAGTGKIPGGTVSVPGLAFTTETNTGLYRPAGADPTIGLAVNGIRAYDILRSAGQVSHTFLGSIGNLSRSVRFNIPDSGDTALFFDAAVEIRKPAGINAVRIAGTSGNTNLAINTNNFRGTLDVSDPTTGSVRTTSIHLGYSELDFYGYRFANISNPSVTTGGIFSIQRGNGSVWIDVLQSDASGNVLTALQSSAPSLAVNQQMTWTLTSNTNLRVSVRGSDGTTRVANITLA